MPIKGKFFPSQVSGEKIFLLVRRHWFIFAAMSLLFVILIIPIFVLIIYWYASPEVFNDQIGNFVIVFGSIYALTVVGLMLYGFVNYYLDVYIVTNKRIVDIKQNGFFNREIAELHLHQVQDVEAKVEGFLQTMFHFGTIYIQTAGERENFVFEDVPHPYRLAKDIVELHEAQIESEYEPKLHTDKTNTDDYHPEDYVNPEDPISIEEKEKRIKKDENIIENLEQKISLTNDESVETMDQPTKVNNNQPSEPIEEFGFGADEPPNDKRFEHELKELSEGEEVSIDDKGKGL